MFLDFVVNDLLICEQRFKFLDPKDVAALSCLFMKRIRAVCFFIVLLFPLTGSAQDTAIFSFGILADVQYADADTWGKRDYRGSLKRLETALAILNEHDLAFTIHAGDLIDRNYGSFDLPLNIFSKSEAPVHYVIGNHEFSLADSLKRRVRKRLNNERGYYAFTKNNFQFILLDAMDVSVHSAVKGTGDYREALAMQTGLKNRNANNAHDYNGGFGPRQLRWLKNRLRRGERAGHRTLLFCHLPLLPENGLHLWNNQEVLALLRSFPSVVAFISGHHHEGGYVKDGNIHHLTLKGLVEARSDTACAVAEVYPDKLVIKGFGDQPDYVLDYPE